MKESLKTSDLWLSAYLLAKGANLDSLEKDLTHPVRCVFFLSGEDLTAKARSFSENGSVPALSFKQIVLDLKHQIYRKNQNIEMRGRER